MDTQVFYLHAQTCKTLSHPKRLQILNILRYDELSAGDIVKKMKISKANLSQHLGRMRDAGILEARRDGVSIHYRILSPKVTKVLLDNLARKQNLMRSTKK